ncbi:S-layer homology domain-containing protein [Cohnella endophytica]|nr:S-layer homology domain-containing protein [Cohnella endophytica]
MLMKRKLVPTTIRFRLALVILLLISLALPSIPKASARSDEPLQVTIGNVSALIGQEIQIPVSIGQPVPGIGSYGIQINFDKSALEALSVSPSYGSGGEDCAVAEEGCFRSAVNNEEGWIRAIWADATGGDRPIAAARELFKIRAKVKGSSSTGAKALSVDRSDISNLTFTDADMHKLNVQVTEGKVTVSPAAGPSTAPAPDESSKVKVIVNGQEQPDSATMTRTKVNDRTVITIHVDEDKVMQQLNDNRLKTLLLPVDESNAAVIGELNGKLVKAMENQGATVAVRTSRANYTLSADQINIDAVASAFGKQIPLQDIKISIIIAGTEPDRTLLVDSAAASGGMNVIVPPVEFRITASYNGQSTEVSQFNRYVERAVALPNDIDPSRITTGVVLNEKGKLVHVPTKITQINGHYYALINSLTNSTYTVVWNPKTFADTKSHWARNEINDLASRLVIQGITDETFAPDRTISRAELTAVLVRALGLHEGKEGARIRFADVGDHDWFRDDVVTAASYGLIEGYPNGTFRPNAKVSRAEAMVLLSRAAAIANLKPATADETDKLLERFTDHAGIGDWARTGVASAIEMGITQGTDNKLLPAQQITRAESAVMIRRMLVQAQLINS